GPRLPPPRDPVPRGTDGSACRRRAAAWELPPEPRRGTVRPAVEGRVAPPPVEGYSSSLGNRGSPFLVLVPGSIRPHPAASGTRSSLMGPAIPSWSHSRAAASGIAGA